MNKLYVLDASAYLYSAYFAIRNMSNAKGESTNALFGFARSVMKLIKDFKPTHFVAVFDGEQSIKMRREIYADYKAHRQSTPGDLIYQIERAKQFCHLMGLPWLSLPNVEADDTMGSIAIWAKQQESMIYLCSGDKDLCQLVNSHVFILNTYKNNLILGPSEVEAHYGVPPELIIDYLAIVGDASDNVPGLSGFGPKTAVKYLKQFGTLENMLNNASAITENKKREIAILNADIARLSRQLVTIDINVDIPKDPEFYMLKQPAYPPLREFYAAMNFHSLIKEFEELQPSTIIQAPEIPLEYCLVDDENSFEELIHLLSEQKEICFGIETTNSHPLQAELVGIGLGLKPGKAWYVPLNGKLGSQKVLESLTPLFNNSSIGFYGHNVKYDCHVLANYNILIANVCFDTILASYLLNSHSRQHSLDALSLELFGKMKTPIKDLLGKGKEMVTMREVPIEKVSDYCCEDVDYTVRLKELFSVQIKERGMDALYFNIELPLIRVLTQMERTGIYLDLSVLQKLSTEVDALIETLEKEIYLLAGEHFNLNSPKQLGTIFEKLGIKTGKKTSTGQMKTDSDALEDLKAKFPIAGKLLEYRGLEKLRSTYINQLPKEINPQTGRIHCSFNQFIAATGRLSCQDPNLQNIPIRSEIGRTIRTAFRPQREGWSYLAADYSQIELRLLAHFSDDLSLLYAFNHGEDVHAFTASQIFNIPLEMVTKDQRNQSKAVNFGVIYGQQAFGLSQELGIDMKFAAEFIDTYFKRYPKVKEFIEAAKEAVRKSGKAVTLTGRERIIPEILTKNIPLKLASERLAVNTPLQGTAADIIKLAMLKCSVLFKEHHLRGQMILQIHDELIFELPDEEIPKAKMIVREAMETVFELKIPLTVDISIGKNWKEC